MKIFRVLSIIQIIAGVVLLLAGAKGAKYNPGEGALAISGALLFISGNYFLYLLFMRSGKH